jgi:hypothetical protein
MVTCANCPSEAIYNYEGITFCETHLPRFLRTKNGAQPVDILIKKDAPRGDSPVDVSLFNMNPEPVVAELVEDEQVEEIPEPAVKKKSANKAN